MLGASASRLDPRQPRGTARDVALGRDHGEQRLTVEADLPLDEKRIVAEGRRHVVLAGDVGGRQHRDDARDRRAPRSRSRDSRRPRAMGDWPMATCSVPSGSRISSM